jgi:hypothetical protein
VTRDPDAPRITQQYRDHDRRMVYELRHGMSVLVLVVTESRDDRTQWRFEAHPMASPQLVVAGSWGDTRASAFGTMRDLWLERGASLGLARIDWECVRVALAAVRAI